MLLAQTLAYAHVDMRCANAICLIRCFVPLGSDFTSKRATSCKEGLADKGFNTVKANVVEPHHICSLDRIDCFQALPNPPGGFRAPLNIT